MKDDTERERTLNHLRAIGVELESEETIHIDTGVTIGIGSKIGPNTCLKDSAVIGERCVIDGGAYIGEGVTVGNDSKIGPNTHLKGATKVGLGCIIEGNAQLLDTNLGQNVQLGFSVTLKKCEVEEGSEVPPFSFLENTHLKKNNEIRGGMIVRYPSVDSPLPRLWAPEKIQKLIDRGAYIPHPETVMIGEEVKFENLSARGMQLYLGTKIFGEKTLILEGAKIGNEESVTLENARLGKNVCIQGGYIEDSVLLDDCEVRQGFHARAGCLLEESVYCAHSVGMKMTIALPFVAFGSLINFCDCFISGGTGRQNHSEIGSGFIHFNFTPRGDKATPSLFGDVPRGVMLNQPPIFLGGLCRVVGPSRIGFGSILSAGNVYRSDYGENCLIEGEEARIRVNRDYDINKTGSIHNKVLKNISYIANIISLSFWYKYVRTLFNNAASIERKIIESALVTVGRNVEERLRQMDKFRILVSSSLDQIGESKGEGIDILTIDEQKEFVEKWKSIRRYLKEFGESEMGSAELRKEFCERIYQNSHNHNGKYIETVQSLSKEDCKIGTRWLVSITDEVMRSASREIPITRCSSF